MGLGYTVFDTVVGRCGIAWSGIGVVGVQLPDAREIDTRRRLFRQFADARELRPPENTEIAIDGIVALLRGRDADFGQVRLDFGGIIPFNQRVYDYVRTIPRGETRSHGEIATQLGVSGALYSVAQALSKNPFMLIVPCHRVRDADFSADKMSANAGLISKRRLLSIEGAHARATLFDVLLTADRPRAL